MIDVDKSFVENLHGFILAFILSTCVILFWTAVDVCFNQKVVESRYTENESSEKLIQ